MTENNDKKLTADQILAMYQFSQCFIREIAFGIEDNLKEFPVALEKVKWNIQSLMGWPDCQNGLDALKKVATTQLRERVKSMRERVISDRNAGGKMRDDILLGKEIALSEVLQVFGEKS